MDRGLAVAGSDDRHRRVQVAPVERHGSVGGCAVPVKLKKSKPGSQSRSQLTRCVEPLHSGGVSAARRIV